MNGKSNIDKNLADIIRARIETLMIQKKKTREDVARAAKIDITTLSKKFNGYVNWKLPECIAIAKLFEEEMNSIFLPQ